MAQEPVASLMDFISLDPPPLGNPTFPPLGKSERPSKNFPPRKSNVQMMPELSSTKTSVPGKIGLGLPKQKKKVSVVILSLFNAECSCS